MCCAAGRRPTPSRRPDAKSANSACALYAADVARHSPRSSGRRFAAPALRQMERAACARGAPAIAVRRTAAPASDETLLAGLRLAPRRLAVAARPGAPTPKPRGMPIAAARPGVAAASTVRGLHSAVALQPRRRCPLSPAALRRASAVPSPPAAQDSASSNLIDLFERAATPLGAFGAPTRRSPQRLASAPAL